MCVCVWLWQLETFLFFGKSSFIPTKPARKFQQITAPQSKPLADKTRKEKKPNPCWGMPWATKQKQKQQGQSSLSLPLSPNHIQTVQILSRDIPEKASKPLACVFTTVLQEQHLCIPCWCDLKSFAAAAAAALLMSGRGKIVCNPQIYLFECLLVSRMSANLI